MYHTIDIFENKNKEERIKWLVRCHKTALKCGLTCRCINVEGNTPELEMWGTKAQFLIYYLKTLKFDAEIKDGIKRWFDFLFG